MGLRGGLFISVNASTSPQVCRKFHLVRLKRRVAGSNSEYFWCQNSSKALTVRYLKSLHSEFLLPIFLTVILAQPVQHKLWKAKQFFSIYFLILFCVRLFLSFNKMIKRNETQKKDKNRNKKKEKSSPKSKLNTTAWI